MVLRPGSSFGIRMWQTATFQVSVLRLRRKAQISRLQIASMLRWILATLIKRGKLDVGPQRGNQTLRESTIVRIVEIRTNGIEHSTGTSSTSAENRLVSIVHTALTLESTDLTFILTSGRFMVPARFTQLTPRSRNHRARSSK